MVQAEDRHYEDDERRRPTVSRHVDRHRRILSEAEVEKLSSSWDGVIEGVVEIDVEDMHRRLERAIRSPRSDALTASAVARALTECQSNYVDAIKIAAKARREYELFKDAFDQWLEPKKSASIAALEEEKSARAAAKEKTKQITNDMVMDRVRAAWGEELRSKRQKVLDFQAATHTLEQSVDAWKQRTHALAKLADLVVAQGDATEMPRGGRSRRERE